MGRVRAAYSATDADDVRVDLSAGAALDFDKVDEGIWIGRLKICDILKDGLWSIAFAV